MLIELSDAERAAGKWEEGNLRRAVQAFRVHGFVSVGNLIAEEKIDRLREGLGLKVEGEAVVGGAKVGDRRFISPVEVAGVFNDPEVFANPFLLEWTRVLMGPQFRVGGLGVVTALPGALEQHLHADHLPLFCEMREQGMHGPFGITVSIALVDVDMLNGPTKVWAGSHLVPPMNLDMSVYQRHLLMGKRGTCHLWDYRTFHAGGANHADEMRPLLYLSFVRSWFQDLINPDEVRIETAAWQGMEEGHRALLRVNPYRYPV